MTPKEKAKELQNNLADYAVEVAGIVLDALKRNQETDIMQLSQENKINYWWEVMLELGYES